MLMAHCPGLPLLAFVQAADFFAFSLRSAVELGFTEIVWGCFFGKLVKMALGYAYTHAGSGAVDFAALADWLGEAGAAQATIAGCREAVTARRVLELLESDPALPGVLDLLAAKALTQARLHAGPAPALALFVFDFDGRLLHLASTGSPD